MLVTDFLEFTPHIPNSCHIGGVAQVVEQRTHKPRAGGSRPSTATILFLGNLLDPALSLGSRFFQSVPRCIFPNHFFIRGKIIRKLIFLTNRDFLSCSHSKSLDETDVLALHRLVELYGAILSQSSYLYWVGCSPSDERQSL